MKITNKRDLITVIEQNAEELHQKIDMHRYLMGAILKQRVGEGTIKRLFLSYISPDEKRLKEAIRGDHRDLRREQESL